MLNAMLSRVSAFVSWVLFVVGETLYALIETYDLLPARPAVEEIVRRPRITLLLPLEGPRTLPVLDPVTLPRLRAVRHITSQPMVGETLPRVKAVKPRKTAPLPRAQYQPLGASEMLMVAYIQPKGFAHPTLVVRLYPNDAKTPYFQPLTAGNCRRILRFTDPKKLVEQDGMLTGGHIQWSGGVGRMLITPSAWTMVQRLAAQG